MISDVFESLINFWKGKGDSEFAFIVESDSQVVPIDVKKGRGTLNSLERFKQHNACSYAVKVSRNAFGSDEKTGILTIPHYRFFLEQVTEKECRPCRSRIGR